MQQKIPNTIPNIAKIFVPLIGSTGVISSATNRLVVSSKSLLISGYIFSAFVSYCYTADSRMATEMLTVNLS
jgi:hypothetical protein